MPQALIEQTVSSGVDVLLGLVEEHLVFVEDFYPVQVNALGQVLCNNFKRNLRRFLKSYYLCPIVKQKMLSLCFYEALVA